MAPITVVQHELDSSWSAPFISIDTSRIGNVMILKTLQREGNLLASPVQQLAILGDPLRIAAGRFQQSLADQGLVELRRTELRTVQINVGKVCNQTCTHCHVDAGPDRRESMSRETAQQVIDFLARSEA